MHAQAIIDICLYSYDPKGHLLILLTFAVSDGMSHALSPQPGEREEELLGVKNKKKMEK